ncbi:transposable element Tcb1 transposase [Trichonephila clavipes]|nr:transposable element Tcb1 transposase [Trichonephila clavipes]
MHLSATPRWSDSSMETPWRENPEQLRYVPLQWSCTGHYGMGRYWISLSHSSSTHCRYFKQPAIHLRSVGASCRSLLSRLGHGHISTGLCATTRDTHCPKVLCISPVPWTARSPNISPIENMWCMVAQRLIQFTPPTTTPDKLWQRVEAACSAVPQEHILSLFASMLRRVAAVISNNGGYSGS